MYTKARGENKRTAARTKARILTQDTDEQKHVEEDQRHTHSFCGELRACVGQLLQQLQMLSLARWQVVTFALSDLCRQRSERKWGF